MKVKELLEGYLILSSQKNKIYTNIYQHEFAQPGDYLLDLHYANMMLRRTQLGYQLVITDPLYNGDER